MDEKSGMVAIYVDEDGRAVASASCFDAQAFSGFSVEESQRIRLRGMCARAALKEYCSPVVWRALSEQMCERIVQSLPGRIEYIAVSESQMPDSEPPNE